MILYSKHIILEQEEFDGFLELEQGKIKALHRTWDGSFENYEDAVILPGFIDIHIHGWATGSFWFEKSPRAVREMCRTLPYAGVTSYLATSGADTIPEIKRCIAAADEGYEARYPGAEMLGVHLEGPFINPKYRGMQREECCIPPSLETMKELYGSFRHKELCRHMTIAAELDGAREVLGFCREHGIQTAIGHSAATFEQIKAVKDAGIGGFTHTFSGMRGFHHRELGVAGAALYFDDMMCEFAKQTGMTVAHEAFDIAYRLKGSERIILTTDCSGLAQTQTEFDHYVRKMKFVKDGDRLRIDHYDGRQEWIDPRDYEAVKGIELSYVKSIQNMARHTKVGWHDIMRMTSFNPAGYIHVDDRKGSITPGKDADLTIVDQDLNLVAVFCRGKEIREQSHARTVQGSPSSRKCAVSDFDRTLYVDGRISDRNLQAVKSWQEAGNWFVLATGRNEASIRAPLEEFGITPDALILNNGALILDRNWRELFCRTIDKDTVTEILTFLDSVDDDGSGVSMRGRKVNVVSKAGTTTQKTCDGQITMEEIGSLEEVVQIHRRKSDTEQISTLCRELNTRFPAISAYSNVCNADIVAHGVNKSAAIDWLARHVGGFDEIRVIGDSANDARMIREYQGATLHSADLTVQAIAECVVRDVAEYLEME